MSFTAAVVQMRSTMNVARNIEAVDRLVREAARRGADYVQTPEMTGLVCADRKTFFETIVADGDDSVLAAASALAEELEIHLHVGSTPVRVAERMAANRAVVFGPDGSRLASYDKIHMFDVDLDGGERWRESAVYRPGERAATVDMHGARVGLAICYDVRFPALHRAYALAGANVLTAPSCFTRQTGQAHWHVLMRARAIENGAYMVAAAQGGEHEDGRTTYGHSVIVDPWGAVIAEVDGESEGLALAEIDVAASEAARDKVPNLRNGRAFAMTGSLPT